MKNYFDYARDSISNIEKTFVEWDFTDREDYKKTYMKLKKMIEIEKEHIEQKN